MTELIITRGLPASGKTTWAKAWVRADEGGRARVNRDETRHNLFGRYWPVPEEAVTIAQRAAVEALLRAGTSVVVDDTNLRAKVARAWAELALDCGADFSANDDFLAVTLDTCLMRDVARGTRGERSVGETVIRGMHNRYLANGIAPAEWPRPPQYEYRPPAHYCPPAWLVDIDGTLARMDGRGPYDWHRVGEDSLVGPVAEAVRALERENDVIVMSGRDSVCRQETEDWLRRHGVFYTTLLMRPEGDTRKDSVVKLELFVEHVAGLYDVRGVLDDRDQVVRMWRRIGLPCFQVAPGAF